MSCSSVGGLNFIEKMPQDQFDNTVFWVRATTTIVLTELIIENIIGSTDLWFLITISDSLRGAANKEASENVGRLLSDLIENNPSLAQYAKRSHIIIALSLVDNFIIERGGWGVIREADGTWLFSARTKTLLIAIAAGISDAVAASPDPVIVPTVLLPGIDY